MENVLGKWCKPFYATQSSTLPRSKVVLLLRQLILEPPVTWHMKGAATKECHIIYADSSVV